MSKITSNLIINNTWNTEGENEVQSLVNKKEQTTESLVHFRLQQRNKKKCITIIEGIGKEFDLKIFKRVFKKEFACNASITKDKDENEILCLQGDHREEIYNFMLKYNIFKKEQLKMHGY